MDQKVKRIINSFVIAFVGVLLVQIVNGATDLTAALQTGDWSSLKQVGVAAVAAAAVAGLRALQAYVGVVPSPEKEEGK